MANLGDILSNTDIGSPGVAPSVVAASGATESLDFGVILHDITMDQDCTFSFIGIPASGKVGSTTLVLSGAFTPTFPAAVVWPDGTAPTYASPAVYTFFTRDGGTIIYGAQAGKAFA